VSTPSMMKIHCPDFMLAEVNIKGKSITRGNEPSCPLIDVKTYSHSDPGVLASG
jgi:hypothetical protein